jgi:hypothetical protein
MSEKIQEFLEAPQEFIREGNQVCNPPLAHASFPSYLRSFLFDAQNPLEKVFTLCFLSDRPFMRCFETQNLFKSLRLSRSVSLSWGSSVIWSNLFISPCKYRQFHVTSTANKTILPAVIIFSCKCPYPSVLPPFSSPLLRGGA